jgi:hypothetical protein
MTDGHATVLRRSAILWVGTAALIPFNFFAATQQDMTIFYVALAATGAFALFGAGFGIWAARIITKRV